jgi:hypothetical protein
MLGRDHAVVEGVEGSSDDSVTGLHHHSKKAELEGEVLPTVELN